MIVMRTSRNTAIGVGWFGTMMLMLGYAIIAALTLMVLAVALPLWFIPRWITVGVDAIEVTEEIGVFMRVAMTAGIAAGLSMWMVSPLFSSIS